MSAADLPSLNAVLNGTSTLLLLAGYAAVKRGRADIHRRFMLAALATSALFLASYLVYHARVGSVPYPRHDWTRPVYFGILIPHVILAGVMVPFILLAVRHAWRRRWSGEWCPGRRPPPLRPGGVGRGAAATGLSGTTRAPGGGRASPRTRHRDNPLPRGGRAARPHPHPRGPWHRASPPPVAGRPRP